MDDQQAQQMQQMMQQAVQAAIQALFANPGQNAAIHQLIQQQAQNQVQARQGQPMQPQAPPFLLNPALVNNNPWDLTSSTGLKIYLAAVDSFATQCDGSEESSRTF